MIKAFHIFINIVKVAGIKKGNRELPPGIWDIFLFLINFYGAGIVFKLFYLRLTVQAAQFVIF